MNKYEVTYKGKTRYYRADTAIQAVDKFERQNKVVVSIKVVDAETRGERSASGYVKIDELGAAPIEWVEMSLVEA